MENPCPQVDEALIRYLEGVFPDQCVDPKRGDPAVAYGSALVIRHLKSKREEQEDELNVSI